MTLLTAAESLLGPTEWVDDVHGFCRCPGESQHTRPTHSHDCRVSLDAVPTVFCFHQSCGTEVAEANRRLRTVLAGGAGRETGAAHAAIPRSEAQATEVRARLSLPRILTEFAWHPADAFENSPVRLHNGPAADWRLLLCLFAADDVIWIGERHESGDGYAARFRRVSDWLRERHAPGPLICPNSFLPGTSHRSKAAIAEMRFLVVESDHLSKPDTLAVFAWLRQSLRLRAIVDTAGKSVHGWFEHPRDSVSLAQLKAILPGLACDPRMLSPAQPCRLPGARRGNHFQSLLWLDLHPA